jgi:mannitol-1-phosphate 5-dehydrogenase
MKILIFGAGKIARGMLGHFLQLSGKQFVFIERSEALVAELCARGKYSVQVMGNPAKDAVITGFEAISLADAEGIARQWAGADIGFTCVGGKNLVELARVLAKAFALRCEIAQWSRPFNLITCENWKEPATLLRREIARQLSEPAATLFEEWVGIAEAVVMKSAVEPSASMRDRDPLSVSVQDFWELPVDANRVKGGLAPIFGVRVIENFAGYLERKFYTYNAANGTTAYLGFLRGHRLIYEAASDPEIIEQLKNVYAETGEALCRKHGVTREDQEAFAASSLRKLQDRNIVDSIERNARDPIRKLGPDDRLVGAARLVERTGVRPARLAVSIAAALHYDEPGDPAAVELRERLARDGIDGALRNICRIEPGESLAELVHSGVRELKEKGWIKK